MATPPPNLPTSPGSGPNNQTPNASPQMGNTPPVPDESVARSDNLESEIFPSPDTDIETPKESPEDILGVNAQNQQPNPTQPAPPSLEPQLPTQPAPSPQTPPAAPTPAPAPPKPSPQPTPPQGPPAPPTPPAGGEEQNVFMEPPKKSFLSRTTILIAVLVILGAALVGAGLYLVFGPEDEPEAPIVTEPPEEEPEEPGTEEPEEEPGTGTDPPDPVITPNFVLNLSVEDLSEETMSERLNAVAGASYPEESLTYVPIQLEGIVVDGEAQFVNAEEFLNAVGIEIPSNLLGVVEPELMLYVYGPGEEERILCQDNLIAEESCWGPRLALAFRAQEGQEAQLEAVMQEWQALAPEANLSDLALTNLVTDPDDAEFGSATYTSGETDVTVHYKNLPMPNYDGLGLSSAALDFAIVDNILIFATSKNSLETMIDAALQVSP